MSPELWQPPDTGNGGAPSTPRSIGHGIGDWIPRDTPSRRSAVPLCLTILGNVSLWLAFLLGIWGSGAGMLAATRRDHALLRSAVRTPLALLGVLSVVLVSLVAGVVRQDFNLALVATRLTRTLPFPYVLGSLAASVPGVLLFVAWVVALVVSVSLWRGGAFAPAQAARLARFGSAAIAAIAVVVLWAAPFARLGYTPLEGQGLVPFARHPLALVEVALIDAGVAALGVAAVMRAARSDAGFGRTDGVVPTVPAAVAWVLISAGLGLRLWRSYAVLAMEAEALWLGGVVAAWVLAGAVFYGSRPRGVGQTVVGAGLGLVALTAAGWLLGFTREIRLATGAEIAIPRPGGPITLSSLGGSRFEIRGGLTSAATLTARGARGPAALLTTEQREYFNVFGHGLGLAETRPGVLHGVLADLRVAYVTSPRAPVTRSPPDEAVFRVRVLPLAWCAGLGFTLMVAGGLLAVAGRRDRAG